MSNQNFSQAELSEMKKELTELIQSLEIKLSTTAAELALAKFKLADLPLAPRKPNSEKLPFGQPRPIGCPRDFSGPDQTGKQKKQREIPLISSEFFD